MSARVTPEIVKALAFVGGIAVDEARARELSSLLQIQVDGAERLLQWVGLEVEPDCRVPQREVARRGGK